MPRENDEMNLLLRGEVFRDASRLFCHEPDVCAPPPDEAGCIIPLQTWARCESVLRQRRHALGILLQTHDNPESLAGRTGVIDPRGIAFIGIHFPSYTDGRGYSLAQMVRRLGWEGELRALGDVLVDNVHYLARCGFDSFLLKPGHDARKAAAALRTFSAAYQRGYGQDTSCASSSSTR